MHSAFALSFIVLLWTFFCYELSSFALNFLLLLWTFFFRYELSSFALNFLLLLWVLFFLLWTFFFCYELSSFALIFLLLLWAFFLCSKLSSFALSFLYFKSSFPPTVSCTQNIYLLNMMPKIKQFDLWYRYIDLCNKCFCFS